MADKKNVLITAGLSGIGSEVAKAFKAKGYCVYLTSSNLSKVDGEEIFHWNMDKTESTKELLRTLKGKNIHIHSFIHCAHKFSEAKPLLAINEETFLSSLNSNLGALFSLSKSLAKLMNRKKSGRILFLGSYLSINPAPGKAMYIIEKNAITGLALALNSEFSKNQVLTHILHPGLVKTPQVEGKISQAVIELVGEENLLAPNDIANNILEIIETENATCIHHQRGNQEWKHSS
jgi:short-subunit dehydrogenase